MAENNVSQPNAMSFVVDFMQTHATDPSQATNAHVARAAEEANKPDPDRVLLVRLLARTQGHANMLTAQSHALLRCLVQRNFNAEAMFYLRGALNVAVEHKWYIFERAQDRDLAMAYGLGAGLPVAYADEATDVAQDNDDDDDDDKSEAPVKEPKKKRVPTRSLSPSVFEAVKKFISDAFIEDATLSKCVPVTTLATVYGKWYSGLPAEDRHDFPEEVSVRVLRIAMQKVPLNWDIHGTPARRKFMLRPKSAELMSNCTEKRGRPKGNDVAAEKKRPIKKAKLSDKKKGKVGKEDNDDDDDDEEGKRVEEISSDYDDDSEDTDAIDTDDVESISEDTENVEPILSDADATTSETVSSSDSSSSSSSSSSDDDDDDEDDDEDEDDDGEDGEVDKAACSNKKEEEELATCTLQSNVTEHAAVMPVTERADVTVPSGV